MSVVAPPEPPGPDGLDLLIREARARQRRRWIVAGAVVAVVTGAATAALATGRKVQETFHGPFKAPPRPPTIKLKPGATAVFALTTSDNPPEGEGACPAPYTRLRIGLARGSVATTVSGWIPYYGEYFQACTGFVVSEIVPKSDLRG